jgi:hypothetical protein
LGNAAAVQVQFGEHRAGVDIHLAPVAAVTVAGRVEGPAEVIPDLLLRLLPSGAEDLGQGSEAATTRVAPDGTFVFLGVPTGAYTLHAPAQVSEFTVSGGSDPGAQLPAPPSRGYSRSSDSIGIGPPGAGLSSWRYGAPQQMSGRLTLDVGVAGASNVLLQLRPLGSIGGLLLFEPGDTQATADGPAFMTVRAESATGRASAGRLSNALPPNDPERRFLFDALVADQYVLRGVAPGWMVKSITYDGRDYTHSPFDASVRSTFSDVRVTFTSAVPVLRGTVRGRLTGASVDSAVIAYPIESDQWTNYGLSPSRIRSVLSTDRGSYRIEGLPAGEYYMAVVSRDEADAWQDPSFFQKMAPRATRVRIGWGEEKTQDLQEAAP